MNYKFLYLLICILGLHSLTAQQHQVIDRKGTQITVTSSQVSTTSTAPANPNEGDVWIDNASNTIKIWEEGTVPAWKEIASIRNWIPSSQNGSYLVNHLVSYEGALYKNLTSTNLDTTPDNDTVNWKEISVDIVPLWKSQTNGGCYATNDVINYNGILYRNRTNFNTDTTPNLDTLNWEYTTIADGSTTNNTLRWNGTDWVESSALTNDGTDIAATGDLKTDTFSTEWVNSTNGGVYAINDIVLYNGGIYKNLTGSNSDLTPNTNATDWETIALANSYEYLIAKSSVTSFTANEGKTYPFSAVLDSDGSSITLPELQNGRYNLAPNGTYRLTADVGIISGSGEAHWRFYNNTDGIYIPNSSTASQYGNDTTDANGATCHAIIRTGASSLQISVRKARGTVRTLHLPKGSGGIARLFIERIR